MKSSFPMLSLVLLAGVTLAPPARAASDPATLVIGDHVFHLRTLANGLRAVAVEDTGKASVFMVIAAGKRQETPETNGLAHLTEHAMYAGTAKTPAGAHDRIVKGMGGESNAYTRDDYTLFYDHLVPVDSLAVVLGMEADRLRGLTFPDSAVIHERGRLDREEAHTWQPSDAIKERVEASVYRVHNYRAGVLDEEGHTRAPSLGVDAVRDFYDRYYHPDDTAVVVVSPLPPDEALDGIEAAFGGLPRGPEIAPPVPEPPVTAPREEAFPYNLMRDRVEYVWIVGDIRDPDRVPLELLARLLKRENADDGSPIDAELGSRVDRELFRLAATGPDARAVLDRLVARSVSTPPDAEALAEVKALVRDDFLKLPLRARPYFSLAGEVGVYSALGLAAMLPDYAATVDAVTPEEVRDAAARNLTPGSRVTVTITGTAKPTTELPEDRKALADLAQEAEAAGDLNLAIAAYTKLLDGETSTMYQVIYLASRGQIRMAQRDYDGAIADFEKGLEIVDYPAVRELLEEATALREGAALRRDDR